MRKLALAAMAAAALASSVPMAQAGSVEVGLLVCDVAGGDGFVFGSTKTVNCTFSPVNGMPAETYSGAISRYGVDLGFTGEAVMKWAVLAKSLDAYDAGALAGSYGGVGAEVTAALGVGTNVLVRKSARDFVLQPVSVQGQTGLNIALGIAELDLASAMK